MAASVISVRSVFGKIRRLVPALSNTMHKGMSGKIAVIGGSFEYTGAPYFAGISALKTGADLSHVFCADAAATPIKSYSPELMVHPVFKLCNTPKLELAEEQVDAIVKQVTAWFTRLSSLIIGPGLGRDPLMLECVKRIIVEAKAANLPMVIDGDGLWIITNNPEIITGYQYAVLTPNVNEYKRLSDALLSRGYEQTSAGSVLNPHELSRLLGNVTILEKGAIDVITNGSEVDIQCSEAGSARRCGGQGDLLAGAIGTFLSWAKTFEKEVGTFREPNSPSLPMLSAAAGSLLIRHCASAAFLKYGRSMVTTNMIDEIGRAFHELFEIH